MDLTQLANLGEFVGGVAVLVTLIYLARQVRHGTRVAQQAAYNGDTRTLQELGLSLSRDKELARLWRLVVENDVSGLDADERTQLLMMASAVMYGYEAAFQSYRDGLIRREQWENAVDEALDLLTSPAFLDIARARRSGLARLTLVEIERRGLHYGLLPHVTADSS